MQKLICSQLTTISDSAADAMLSLRVFGKSANSPSILWLFRFEYLYLWKSRTCVAYFALAHDPQTPKKRERERKKGDKNCSLARG